MILKNKINLFLAVFLLNFCKINHTKDIFFDLGGVIFETSKARAISKLGFKCFFYPDLQNHFFEFLCYIDPKNDEPEDDEATYKGSKLPPLLCKWQKGKFNCYEVSNFICDQVDKHPEFFESKLGSGKTKKNLIKTSASLFLPENAVYVTKPKKEMIRLLKEIRNQKDKNGNPAHKLGIISNHDWETVQAFMKAYPEIFENFDQDRIIISSQVKMIKPNKNIYQHVKKKFKLSDDAAENIFIDDQDENIISSDNNGFTGIKHISANKTRKQLKKLGVIK